MYLDIKNFVHRDLAARNILVATSGICKVRVLCNYNDAKHNQGRHSQETSIFNGDMFFCCCQIADFGLSRDLQYENYYVANGRMIPVKWTAPEALMHRKYSSASDLWSYGCLLYEIWSLGYKPFHDVTNAEVNYSRKKNYLREKYTFLFRQ